MRAYSFHAHSLVVYEADGRVVISSGSGFQKISCDDSYYKTIQYTKSELNSIPQFYKKVTSTQNRVPSQVPIYGGI